jgi:hypothetical protein
VFFHLKGLSIPYLHTESVQEVRPHAIAYSTVTKYIRNDAILQNEPEAEDGVEDQGFSIPDNVNLETLEMMPFAPIRQIAEMTVIPVTFVFRRLTKSLDFVLKRSRWVPHILSDLQKQARIIMSKELLKLLESMRHHLWKYIVLSARPVSIFLSFS